MPSRRQKSTSSRPNRFSQVSGVVLLAYSCFFIVFVGEVSARKSDVGEEPRKHESDLPSFRGKWIRNDRASLVGTNRVFSFGSENETGFRPRSRKRGRKHETDLRPNEQPYEEGPGHDDNATAGVGESRKRGSDSEDIFVRDFPFANNVDARDESAVRNATSVSSSRISRHSRSGRQVRFVTSAGDRRSSPGFQDGGGHGGRQESGTAARGAELLLSDVLEFPTCTRMFCCVLGVGASSCCLLNQDLECCRCWERQQQSMTKKVTETNDNRSPAVLGAVEGRPFGTSVDDRFSVSILPHPRRGSDPSVSASSQSSRNLEPGMIFHDTGSRHAGSHGTMENSDRLRADHLQTSPTQQELRRHSYFANHQPASRNPGVSELGNRQDFQGFDQQSRDYFVRGLPGYNQQHDFRREVTAHSANLSKAAAGNSFRETTVEEMSLPSPPATISVFRNHQRVRQQEVNDEFFFHQESKKRFESQLHRAPELAFSSHSEDVSGHRGSDQYAAPNYAQDYLPVERQPDHQSRVANSGRVRFFDEISGDSPPSFTSTDDRGASPTDHLREMTSNLEIWQDIVSRMGHDPTPPPWNIELRTPLDFDGRRDRHSGDGDAPLRHQGSPFSADSKEERIRLFTSADDNRHLIAPGRGRDDSEQYAIGMSSFSSSVHHEPLLPSYASSTDFFGPKLALNVPTLTQTDDLGDGWYHNPQLIRPESLQITWSPPGRPSAPTLVEYPRIQQPPTDAYYHEGQREGATRSGQQFEDVPYSAVDSHVLKGEDKRHLRSATAPPPFLLADESDDTAHPWDEPLILVPVRRISYSRVSRLGNAPNGRGSTFRLIHG